SYMRGSVFETSAARAGLVSDMHTLANKLRQAGNSKAVDKARKYEPRFFMGLPPGAQADVQRLIASALG
ncbi:MAG TPA: hypothetical protein VFC03_13195, partial [Acidimicrobiales bacterium]|nr:hypothetical protein [Acidimicrobiales bacterium]